MKTLITGSRGGIGQLLVPALIEAKEEVGELNLYKKTKADRIIHLAASSGSITSRDIIDSNISYLRKVVNYALEREIPEFIFFSSVDVYGELEEENASEWSPIIRPSLYGITKLFGERYLENAPLTSLSLRLPGVLTVKNSSNIFGRIFDQLRMGKTINVTNPDKLFNGYITVDSLALFLQKVRLTEGNDCINLAARREKTLKQMIFDMHEKIGSQSSIYVSEEKERFLTVSTNKAEEYYEFTPELWDDYVPEWLEKRMNDSAVQNLSHK